VLQTRFDRWLSTPTDAEPPTLCEHCQQPGALQPITARLAHATTHLREGDLCCTSCRTGLRQDADAIDALTLDRETEAAA
jgi:hypothetical protein